ncbi:hypothetical protein AMC87_PD00397 (plasmid) [Rhizobium phaseoli]|nr:hypothetical protein AMC89_PD00392 [Rhizobium phaseoli]ANL50522.1 hypothetical protein AMC87_PD00397 [Rhizobium phaseoli]ANM01561.1 hypothetical protein AMC79_PD00392 [Rhizobium phaseoli]EGE59254.1 methyl-accepting chemotaxis sensory transducer with Pas/Pac sensor [Rhizobium etli CNPAF512]
MPTKSAPINNKLIIKTALIRTREYAVAATVLGGISQAINTVDQGTQQNAATVEEQTAAGHGLALFELLEQFRFEDARKSRSSSAMERHLSMPAALKLSAARLSNMARPPSR